MQHQQSSTKNALHPKHQRHHCHHHHHQTIIAWFIGLTCSGIFYYFLLLLTLLPSLISTRRLQRCELASELYILDVPKIDLPLWLCIAEFESRFNTHVIGTRNEDGSYDYGIFQISDKFWCLPENDTEYFNFNDCNINCTELLMDDITPAVKCARTILKQQGWEAWTVYEEFCNDTLEEARKLNQCTLARELLKFGIPKQELAIWTCIARFESKFNTTALARNGNWSNDYGLFQISDRYWCISTHLKRPSENMCKMDCQRLLSDDIRDTIHCAQIVKKRQGWRAWAAYNGICGRKQLPEIDDCF